MKSGKVWVRCAVSRSAFSGERVFAVKLVGGETYSGIAPRHYCLVQGRDIKEDEPASDQVMDGVVQAHLVRNGGDQAEVVIPDGELVTVPVEAVSA